jgi:hypothetical protein
MDKERHEVVRKNRESEMRIAGCVRLGDVQYRKREAVTMRKLIPVHFQAQGGWSPEQEKHFSDKGFKPRPGHDKLQQTASLTAPSELPIKRYL